MLIVAFLILGFGGIVAQTLLLRELLVLFSGNELSLGLIIGSWIVSEALGALLAGIWAERRKVDAGIYMWVTLLFSAAFPATVYLTRVFKILAGIPLETAVSISTVLYASFVLLLPTGFLHGFLFSLACSLYARLTGTNGASAGKVYFYETLGTIAGGLAISYLLIPYLHAFQIALGLVVLNGVSCLLLLTSYRARRAVLTYVLTVIVFVALPVTLLIRGADSLHTMSIKQAFPGRNLVHYENSFYQTITVVRTEDQYVFFTDGLPVVTTPVPDIAFVEEFVHFSLSAYPSPETILFLGNGAGGAINEALKYPSVKQIDYVELDPALLRTIGRFETPLTRTELGDPRVHIHYVDGRRFVRETGTRYDVVLLGHSAPSTLQKNRFYTEEFFLLVRRLLTEKGVFAFSLPGSGAYYGPELKAVNKSVLGSLTQAFPHQYVVPGETNIVLASPSADILSITPALVYDALRAAGIETRLITQAHLTERFQQKKQDWFRAALSDVRASPNRDFQPSAVFHQITYENLMLAPSLKPIFAGVLKISFPAAALFVVLICCMVFLAGRKSARVALPFALTTTGFACMVTELMLIFGFQVVYGYVFYEIAILITAFMTGIAAGSLFVTSLLRVRRQLQLFIFIEAALILFILFQVAIFSFLEASAPSRPVATHILFLLPLFLSGVFAGLEFPLATRIFHTTHSVERSVGVLYAADLAGGWIGGLVTGFILFPVLGLFNTCLVVALLKAGSFTFLLVQQKRGIIR
jgi:spermidine synthase